MTDKQNLLLSDDELLRYSRQILLDDWDVDAQIALKSSCVVIVGMGGLGCPVASILARAGVGRLHLVDFDRIEASNLQRQTLYTASHIGLPKAETACTILKSQNEFIDISFDNHKIDERNIDSMLARIKPDLLIDCTDNFDIRQTINTACIKNNVPLLFSSAIGEIGQLAVFGNVLGQKYGCYECLFGADTPPVQNCASSGVLASTVAVVGAMASQVALTLLAKKHNPIAGQLVLWQGKTITVQKLNFTVDADCSCCGME